MATCRDVITQALQQSRIAALGDAPEDSEITFGLTVLQSLFDNWVSSGMFGRMKDVYKTIDYTAQEQDRVITSGSPTITIPDAFGDDDKVGTTRPPYDLSLIEVVGATRKVWLYDTNGWVDINALALGDTCPLARRGNLAAVLALEIHGPFKDAPHIQKAAGNFLSVISLKHGTTSRPRTAEYY